MNTVDLAAVVPKLRECANKWGSDGSVIMVSPIVLALCDAAKERDEWKRRAETAEGELHDCPVCHRKCKECDCMEKQVADLRTLLAECREALEPFARDKANRSWLNSGESDFLASFNIGGSSLKNSDLCRAAALLARLTEALQGKEPTR